MVNKDEYEKARLTKVVDESICQLSKRKAILVKGYCSDTHAHTQLLNRRRQYRDSPQSR